MRLEDLQLYLPKFLSQESENALIEAIKKFPSVDPEKFYTQKLTDSEIIYQGDGIKNLLVVNLPATETKKKEGIILSNTCDIDQANQRPFESRIIYAPIIKLKDYISVLTTEGEGVESIDSHCLSIRKQHITQIFYLPEISGILDESIVFLDRIFNLPNSFVDRSALKEQRIFTLSDFGSYLFIFKLSIHFTRIQDKVERGSL